MTTNLPPPSKDMWAFAQRFTRADCERWEELGFLNYRYELIEGVIIPKTPHYLTHALTLSRAEDWLKGHFGYEKVLSQPSISVAPDETVITHPEPDVLLLNKSGRDIPANEPRPEDISLVVEVSDTTLAYDLGTKAGVYSRAGIAQYLVLDVNGRVVYDPTLLANGDYSRVAKVPGDAVTLLHAPDLALVVDDLLLP